MKISIPYMNYLKKNLKNKFFLLLPLLLLCSCLQMNDKQFRYWKDFYSLQSSIKSSINFSQYLALSGNLTKEREKDLKVNEEGNFYIEIGGKKNLENWNFQLYPAKYEKLDYHSKVIFTPAKWEDKEIYTIERETKSNWNGFFPKDFFSWLNLFSLSVVDHQKLLQLKNSLPSFVFLCNTFSCQTTEEAKSILLEFAFNEITESKFPNFAERFGNRLNKTQLEMRIFDEDHPEDQILISNQGKILQFRFPVSPRKEIFKNPRSLLVLTNITIKSYGVTLNIQEIKYRLHLISQKDKDELNGKFLSFKSRKFTGNFLYFIPTGVIDFFIPGNIDEYLSDALKLLIYGTQGKGGSQFKVIYKRIGNSQTNILTTYMESLRNRFSLFGADASQMDNPDQDFFTQWEKNLLLDLN